MVFSSRMSIIGWKKNDSRFTHAGMGTNAQHPLSYFLVSHTDFLDFTMKHDSRQACKEWLWKGSELRSRSSAVTTFHD